MHSVFITFFGCVLSCKVALEAVSGAKSVELQPDGHISVTGNVSADAIAAVFEEMGLKVMQMTAQVRAPSVTFIHEQRRVLKVWNGDSFASQSVCCRSLLSNRGIQLFPVLEKQTGKFLKEASDIHTRRSSPPVAAGCPADIPESADTLHHVWSGHRLDWK